LLGGALGFAIGGMVAKANLHNQNVVNTAAEEALKIGTKESSKIFLETVASGTGIALVEKVAEEAIQKGTPTVIAKVCEQLTRPEVQNIIILNAFPGALDCLAIMRSEKRANVRVNRANQRVIEAENAQEIAEQESHQKTEEVIALKAIAAQRLETIERQKQREKETKDQIAELVRRNSMEQNPPQESLAQHRDRMFTHLSSRLSSALPSDSPNRENTDEEHIGMHRRHPHLSSNEENGLPRRLFQ
ncbi:MAG TPA: hypothetical protein VHZ76_09280, partial [Gammaproteobacteria bacterium]|nr:hypothetical protein [Gammaproteobacteria bacterium]